MYSSFPVILREAEDLSGAIMPGSSRRRKSLRAEFPRRSRRHTS